MNHLIIKNNQIVPIEDIPLLTYSSFLEENTQLIIKNTNTHCVNYFGYPFQGKIKLICCIANDETSDIYLSSCFVQLSDNLDSFTEKHFSFHVFEREIHENFGINYTNHPWLKPIRYPFNRFDKTKTINNYPFYNIDSDELHEVGVGPIHAGVIEPGHFRFICSGEQIIHLEIQLGYQHRGIEQLFIEYKKPSQLTILAESIAGDTVVGHSTAFSSIYENLSSFASNYEINFSRTLALELERIAIHTGDLSALCTDIAYQLGSAVFGRLRTPIVNFMQEWCGNRLSKGLIRPAWNKFPFTNDLGSRLEIILNAYEKDFVEMNKVLFKLPSALSRFERTGIVSESDLRFIGAVGMAARMNNVERDIRKSHPHALYNEIKHTPIVKHHGDVYSRAQIRKQEVIQSLGYVRQLIKNIPKENNKNQDYDKKLSLMPNSFAISLVEGWRGEICHCAITDESGEFKHYKVKDPSLHNWFALALSVRNNEISDFPICNKSFNLSYCGHDL